MEKEERRSLGVERVNGREMIKKSERANGVKEQRKRTRSREREQWSGEKEEWSGEREEWRGAREERTLSSEGKEVVRRKNEKKRISEGETEGKVKG